MTRVILEQAAGPTTGERPFEVAERKGTGHPDFICDAIMEEAAGALARAYLEKFGSIQHFNLDKGLLAAGRASPALGGGSVDEPMRLIFGDRAVYEREGLRVPVAEILEASARSWMSQRLRFVDPQQHVTFQNQIRPGSTELVELFEGGEPRANDTSAAVGFAPLTETERLVLEAEDFLNSPSFKGRFAESGEDIKVMGVRHGRTLELTVAMAFVDRFLTSERDYFQSKESILLTLEEHLKRGQKELDAIHVYLNTLDRPGKGLAGMYLTVTGTSAEGGDSGQVGRGNRLSGLFSVTRPVSNEAAAGKNPLCHVGKIYNVLARQVAARLAALSGVREATVYLVSQIGDPLARPHFAAAQLVLEDGVGLSEVAVPVEAAVEGALEGAESFAGEWLSARSRESPSWR